MFFNRPLVSLWVLMCSFDCGMDWGLCVGLPVEVMAVPAMGFGPLHLVQLEAGAGSCGTVVLTSRCCVGK